MKAQNIWKSSPFWVAQRHSPPCPVSWRSSVWGQELTPHLWIETIFPFRHMALARFVSKWNGVKETFGKRNKNGILFPFLVFFFVGFFFFLRYPSLLLKTLSPRTSCLTQSRAGLAPSGFKWSHNFGVSRQKIHWKSHRRGFVLPKEDEKLQEKPGCWLQR